MKYTKLKGSDIDAESALQIKEIKVLNTEGASVFEVGQEGTVKHGKSRNEVTNSAQGLIIKSENGNRWSLQISNTGQLVTTNLGGE